METSFSARLKTAMAVRKLKQADLCALTGISKSAMSQYLSGVFEPKQMRLWRMAAVLNVDEAWLMGYDVPMERTPEAIPTTAVPADLNNTAPLLGCVAAGLPLFAEENIEGYIPIMQTDGARYFWLRVCGDSMTAAGIADGDEILVRVQPEVENGQLAVVLVNGDEATVKRFRRDGEVVVLTPCSYNPVHQPQIYHLDQTPVSVVGLVVEARKKFT